MDSKESYLITAIVIKPPGEARDQAGVVYFGKKEFFMPEIPTQARRGSIAAIVPTYNEAINVQAVLKVLQATSMLDEIVLVDDGSTDKTLEILKNAAAVDQRMQVIRHDTNKGKGQAIFSGWAATKAPILLLLDADLKNLTPDHIEALLRPVIEHRADMTLGLFRHGHLLTDLSHWLTPFLTGQRGLRSELLKHISREAAQGYGFEVALTVAAGQLKYRSRFIFLDGVWHPSSELRTERGGYWNGRVWRYRMYGQIIRAWFIATGERHPRARNFFSEIIKY
jgi:glycosyltransferase involved in cell wall biosynthesis